MSSATPRTATRLPRPPIHTESSSNDTWGAIVVLLIMLILLAVVILTSMYAEPGTIQPYDGPMM